MPDFLADSRVTRDPERPDRLHATLSPSWAVWGPSGGYLAAIALRSAMAESRLARPASFHCHFLASGAFEPVEIAVASLGGGKRAESLRVDLTQAGRMLLTASVWMVDDGMRGYEHESAQAPDVPRPEALKSFRELEPDTYDDWYPIWRSMEGRPTRWREGPREPRDRTWLRFTETPVRDRADDALRQLFWLDYPGWNATTAAHPWPFRYLAPNLDLGVQFHRFAPEEDWMLAEGYVPIAAEGVLGCTSRLWTRDGRLLATGVSKHVCRPNPGYEAELARARELGAVTG